MNTAAVNTRGRLTNKLMGISTEEFAADDRRFASRDALTIGQHPAISTGCLLH